MLPVPLPCRLCCCTPLRLPPVCDSAALLPLGPALRCPVQGGANQQPFRGGQPVAAPPHFRQAIPLTCCPRSPATCNECTTNADPCPDLLFVLFAVVCAAANAALATIHRARRLLAPLLFLVPTLLDNVSATSFVLLFHTFMPLFLPPALFAEQSGLPLAGCPCNTEQEAGALRGRICRPPAAAAAAAASAAGTAPRGPFRRACCIRSSRAR